MSKFYLMVTQARCLIQAIDEEDLLSSISRDNQETIVYTQTTSRRGIKKKKTHTDSLEIIATDLKIDLTRAIVAMDYDGIVHNYYALANLLNW